MLTDTEFLSWNEMVISNVNLMKPRITWEVAVGMRYDSELRIRIQHAFLTADAMGSGLSSSCHYKLLHDDANCKSE